MEMKLTISKSGLPCLWEEGGAYSNTGRCTIIAGAKGQAKKPIYVRQCGSLACSEHALIPIQCGDYVIMAYQHRQDFSITIYRICNITAETAEAEKIHDFDMGEWNDIPEKCFDKAIDAAKNKATCYHCRTPHFIKREG